MARIRSVKPEMFSNEDLASVTVTAERTFVGLLTQADDEGRFRDHAAIIRGALWALREAHTTADVEEDLRQLADAGLICRYIGGDGKRYLHVVTFRKHQKIDKPTASRLPACPVHNGAHTGDSPRTHRGLAKPSNAPKPTPAPAAPPARSEEPLQRAAQARPEDGTSPNVGEPAGQWPAGRDSARIPRGLAGDSAPGSRILDPGSTPNGGGFAAPPADIAAGELENNPAPGSVPPPAARTSADQLVAEYVNSCKAKPPRKVRGHLGKVIRDLLDEGISADHIRAGLELYRAKPLSPSLLPDMVHEAANAQPSTSRGRHAAPYRAWTNPTDENAYGGDL